MTAQDFRQVRENLDSSKAADRKRKQEEEARLSDIKDQKRSEKRKRMLSKLSFMNNDEDLEEGKFVVLFIG